MAANEGEIFDLDLLIGLLEAEMEEIDLDIAVCKEVKSNIDSLKEEEAQAMKLLDQCSKESLAELQKQLNALRE